MAAKQENTSQTLNYALVIAVLLLVGLFVYGNHFRKQMDALNAPPEAPIAAQAQTGGDEATDEPKVTARTIDGAEHPPTPTPLSIADNPDPSPPGTTGTLDDPKEVKRIVANQSRQLRAEAAAQGFRPEDKRALALTEEEIRELEQSGNIIQ